MRGRKPTPTALQIARGDPRKRGIHKLQSSLESEPAGTRGLPKCPKHLVGTARAAYNFWREELSVMGQDKRCDRQMLECAAISYQMMRSAHKLLSDDGLYHDTPVTTKRGTTYMVPMLNDAFNVLNKSMVMVNRFCAEFGLSPVSRTRLSMGTGERKKDDLMELLSMPRAPKESRAPSVTIQ